MGGLGSPQFVLKIYRPIKDFLENTNENIKVGDYIITVQSEYHYQYIRVLQLEYHLAFQSMSRQQLVAD